MLLLVLPERPARLSRRRRRTQRTARSGVRCPTGLAIHIADPSLAAVMLPTFGLGRKHEHRAGQHGRAD